MSSLDHTQSMELNDSIPQIFAEGIVSLADRYEFGCTMSADGKDLYIGVELGNRTEILHYKWIDDDWSNPQVIVSDSIYGMNDPMLSPDETRLYFISTLHQRENPERTDHDIYYVEISGDGWSKPIAENHHINTEWNEYYISFTGEGHMYFGSDRHLNGKDYSDFNIFQSELKNGQYQSPALLPSTINTHNYEADVYIAPDESYMIFCSIRKEGFGRGDLYISFKDSEGYWMEAINMGPEINDEGHQLCPYVSQYNNKFYYTSNKDIYFVDVEFIDKLKEKF